jgi:hypothetical protein
MAASNAKSSATAPYWQTTYDDVNRITTRIFYSAAGVPEATNSVQLDRRGNVIQKVDAGNNVFTTAFDGLDRAKVVAGPAIVTVTSSRKILVHFTDHLCLRPMFSSRVSPISLTPPDACDQRECRWRNHRHPTMDALGRTTSAKIYSSSGSLVREKYLTYSSRPQQRHCHRRFGGHRHQPYHLD